MDKALYERDPERYCREKLGLEEVRILIPKICRDMLISYDGFRMHISGRTGERIICKNANQLVVSPEQAQYVKRISKYLERCRQELLDKLDTKRYRVKYATPAETLRQHREKFATLALADQCCVLMQILNLFNTTAANADLKLLCGKAGVGVLLISKNLDNGVGHNLRLIHQSVIGVFEREIDLMGDVF